MFDTCNDDDNDDERTPWLKKSRLQGADRETFYFYFFIRGHPNSRLLEGIRMDGWLAGWLTVVGIVVVVVMVSQQQQQQQHQHPAAPAAPPTTTTTVASSSSKQQREILFWAAYKPINHAPRVTCLRGPMPKYSNQTYYLRSKDHNRDTGSNPAASNSTHRMKQKQSNNIRVYE